MRSTWYPYRGVMYWRTKRYDIDWFYHGPILVIEMYGSWYRYLKGWIDDPE